VIRGLLGGRPPTATSRAALAHADSIDDGVGHKGGRRPPLFPGYAFVSIELQWHDARWCPGVATLIKEGLARRWRWGSWPSEVPPTYFPANASAESSEGVASRTGQTVRIVRGAFTGKLALFAGMEPHDRVAVLLATSAASCG
jgi:transcription antitermination factor NusG